MMVTETYLDEVRERLRDIRGVSVQVVRDDAESSKIIANVDGRRGELRITRDLEPAGEGDILFVGHAFSDVPRLLEAVRSGTHLSVAEAAEVKTRISATGPSPWTAFIESEGGQGGCDAIRISEIDGEPDMYLWFGSDLAPSGMFRFVAAARHDIPALLAFAWP